MTKTHSLRVKQLFVAFVAILIVTPILADDYPSDGYYRIKNVGTGYYSFMESDHYCGVRCTPEAKYTEPGTVFKFRLESTTPNKDGAYPIKTLQAQSVNVVNDLSYCSWLLRYLPEENFNTLRDAFASSATNATDKANIEAYTYNQYLSWTYDLLKTLYVMPCGDGYWYNYEQCHDFPVTAADNDQNRLNGEMNNVWARTDIQTTLGGFIDRFFTTQYGNEHRLLNETMKSMLKEFRFGGKLYLASESTNHDFVFESTPTEASKWEMETIDETNYFAVAPNEIMKKDNKYYSTAFYDFAVTLSTGIKAYYVTQVADDIAICTQIEGNILPAFTPAILECESTNAADNILTPTAMTTDLYEYVNNTLRIKNILDYHGVYSGGTRQFDDETLIDIFASTNYYGEKNDQDNFRVLSYTAGKGVAFYKYSGTYMALNKAYLNLTNSASSKEISTLLLNFGDEAPTGIGHLGSEASRADGKTIYDLQGRRVTKPEKGIYIVNGKKVIF